MTDICEEFIEQWSDYSIRIASDIQESIITEIHNNYDKDDESNKTSPQIPFEFFNHGRYAPISYFKESLQVWTFCRHLDKIVTGIFSHLDQYPDHLDEIAEQLSANDDLMYCIESSIDLVPKHISVDIFGAIITRLDSYSVKFIEYLMNVNSYISAFIYYHPELAPNSKDIISKFNIADLNDYNYYFDVGDHSHDSLRFGSMISKGFIPNSWSWFRT